MDILLEKSIANCHCFGVDSLVIKDAPHMVRVFVARREHQLWRNDPSTGCSMSVALHQHHCDVTLQPIIGQVHNVATSNQDGCYVGLRSYDYTSPITEKGRFLPVDRTLLPVGLRSTLMTVPTFLCASTLHTIAVPMYKEAAWYVEVPDGDLLIHAGDCLRSGLNWMEVADFNDWFSSQTHKHKVFIAGNHDWLFEKSSRAARQCLSEGVTYLRDSGVEIEGLSIWGSPWTPEFMDWAFNLPRGEELRKKWAEIPPKTDILVTHGPPYGLCDQIQPRRNSEHLGCAALDERVRNIGPRLHVFGHIHGGYGRTQNRCTQFVNASVLNEAYQVVNEPIVVDL